MGSGVKDVVVVERGEKASLYVSQMKKGKRRVHSIDPGKRASGE
jgi:hypothetical protein